MELERWDPWKEFFSIQKEVNSLFNEFFKRLSFRCTVPAGHISHGDL